MRSTPALPLVIVGLLAAGPALAQRRAGPPKPAEPMSFQLVTSDPDAPADKQVRWVVARGSIVPETPKVFEAFLKTVDLTATTIYFDSSGGSIQGGLGLGELLRKANARVSIGRSMPVETGDARAAAGPAAAPLPRHQLIPNLGQCHSSCSYAFLGGRTRTIPIGAQFGVHMFWPGDKMEGIYDRKYSYEEIERAQRISARIAAYMQQMGVDVRMLDIAARVPPKGAIRRLTPREIIDLKVASIETGLPLFSGAGNWGLLTGKSNASLSTGGTVPAGRRPDVRYVVDFGCSSTRGFHTARLEQVATKPLPEGTALAMRRVLLVSGSKDAVIAHSDKDIRAYPPPFLRVTTTQAGSWIGKSGVIVSDVIENAIRTPADGLKLVIDEGDGTKSEIQLPLGNLATQYRSWASACDRFRQPRDQQTEQ